MIRFRLLAMCCGGAMALMAAPAPPAAAYEYRYNLSSHSAAFFKELMSGPAWIVHRPENLKRATRCGARTSIRRG